MTTGPYRESPRKALPPARLECRLVDGTRLGWVRGAGLRGFLGVVAVAIAYDALGPWGCLVVAALTLVWILAGLPGDAGRVVWKIDGASVRILRPGDDEALVLELDALHEIRLDTRTQSRNLSVTRADGLNSVFGSLAPTGRRLDVDVARIELDVDGLDEPVLLSRDYISYSLCTESLRSIRLFLRGHGWKPLDERGPEGE